MKRFIRACQFTVITLFIVKIAFMIDALTPFSLSSHLSVNPIGKAIAETTPRVVPTSVADRRDVTEDGLNKERELLTLLQKKQKELDARESRIKAEEAKLEALKSEIMSRIDELKSLEARLAKNLEAASQDETKRLKDLAKVYEASPPQKAATMLEKLDTQTAAGITINMNRAKAGLIWGFLNPQKAVEITNEITKAAY